MYLTVAYMHILFTGVNPEDHQMDGVETSISTPTKKSFINMPFRCMHLHERKYAIFLNFANW